MRELVEFDAGDGARLVVEVDDDDGADYVRAASPGQMVGRAADHLQDTLQVIRTSADAVLAQVRSLDVMPAEVQAEFGIKLTGKVGAVLASSQGEAHLMVTMKWTRDS